MKMTKSVEHKVSFPSYNLSVCSADSSPSRGASGEEAKFSDMPKPPLGRSNNDDRRQWRKQGVAVGAAASKTQAERCGCWVPHPGSGSASALTERLLPPRRLIHPLHRLRVLGLSTGALADDDRLEAALCQQLHQGLGLRAELGLGKGPVALLAAGGKLDGNVCRLGCAGRAVLLANGYWTLAMEIPSIRAAKV